MEYNFQLHLPVLRFTVISVHRLLENVAWAETDHGFICFMVSHVIFSPVVVCSVPRLMKLLLGKVGTGWEEFCPVLQDCSVAEAAGTVARHRTGDMHEEEYSFHLLFPLVD